MAQCPQCQGEYTPEPGHDFCDNCGMRLPDGQVAEAVAEVESVQVTGAATTEASPAPDSAGPDFAGNVKVQGVGEGMVAGGNITVTNTVQQKFCAAGHEELFGDRTLFQCPECHRYPVCDRHFDQGRGMCSSCVEGPKIACALCNDPLPASETFTCRRCKRIVGNDHLDPDREQWCADCSEKWAGVVESIERDEVGISMDGTVVGRDDVELKDKVLQTKDGKPVSTIKENIWYAKPKQWYRVKSRLLRQEQQAMRRFYPALQLQNDPNGDLFWQGAVTTWTGNDYEIQLRYPDSFPYRPPKAYVINPKIEQSRHIYPDGHLCLFHKDDKTWEPNTTGATVMSWISLWLHCYEVWLETGTWPRKEHDDMVISTDY